MYEELYAEYRKQKEYILKDLQEKQALASAKQRRGDFSGMEKLMKAIKIRQSQLWDLDTAIKQMMKYLEGKDVNI